MALDPNKIALCWPNYIDSSALSGGSYISALPLVNAKDERFAVIAKTASADPSATQGVVTFTRRRAVACFAVAAHNFSVEARLRVKAYRDEGLTDLASDSGWQDVWPVVYGLGDVVWGDSNFWNRRLSSEDRAAYTPLTTVFMEPTTATAVTFEIDDANNSAGALTFGRLFVSDAWQPRTNVGWGIQDGYDSGTDIVQAGDKARTEYARRVTPKRTVSFDLKHLDDDEAFLRIHRLRRTQDIVGDVLYVFSPTPSPENFARTFIGRQTALDGITHPYVRNFSTTINLLEKL